MEPGKMIVEHFRGDQLLSRQECEVKSCGVSKIFDTLYVARQDVMFSQPITVLSGDEIIQIKPTVGT